MENITHKPSKVFFIPNLKECAFNFKGHFLIKSVPLY